MEQFIIHWLDDQEAAESCYRLSFSVCVCVCGELPAAGWQHHIKIPPGRSDWLRAALQFMNEQAATEESVSGKKGKKKKKKRGNSGIVRDDRNK